MITEITKTAETRMAKSIDSLKSEFSKLRTGRAHPNLLDHIKVNYYGADMPLNQVANIAVDGPRMLLVSPWEKGMVQPIEKAIRESDLGLNPATSGQTIRVPLPQLTEERRRDLTKVARDEAENARIAIRNIRRDANAECKQLLKGKSITEDEERRAQTEIQKLTDHYVSEVDAALNKKEAEMMEV